MALVAGVDSSTQSTKVVVIDADDGAVVASGSAPHEVRGSHGARETAPQTWAGALEAALAATGCAGDVAAMSVAAQQHGLVVLGAGGEVLRPAILWNDTRASAEASQLVEALGGPQRCAATVGSVLTPAFTVASWAWLRQREPAVARAAKSVCLPHDYLTALLTSGPAATDRSDASGTGWWSPAEGRYAEEILGHPAVALDPGQLPAVLAGDEPAGHVSGAAARRFGLREDALVGAGAGDNAAAALGVGLEPGEAVLSLGTSGTAFAVAERPAADGSGIVAGFASADGRYLPLACTLNATLAVDRVAALLGLDRDDVAPAGEVVFVPWLDGERTPNLPFASGSLTGIRADTDRRSILQAAYEGAAGTLVAALDRVDEWTPARDGPLFLVGGGSRSAVWRQVVGRLTGRALVVPDAAELVALGAAVQAASLLGREPPAAVARRWGTRRGATLDAVERDGALVERIRGWSEAVAGAERRS